MIFFYFNRQRNSHQVVVQRPLRHGPSQLVTRFGRAQIRLGRSISFVQEPRGASSLVSIWLQNQFQLAIFVRTKFWLPPQIHSALVAITKADVCVMGFFNCRLAGANAKS